MHIFCWTIFFTGFVSVEGFFGEGWQRVREKVPLLKTTAPLTNFKAPPMPFFVRLVIDKPKSNPNNTVCGGVLLSAYHVLTATLCVLACKHP